MRSVIIDGVKYVPEIATPEPMPKQLQNCLDNLVAIQMFPECANKHRAWAWDALNALSPSIAELASNNPREALEYLQRQADKSTDQESPND